MSKQTTTATHRSATDAAYLDARGLNATIDDLLKRRPLDDPTNAPYWRTLCRTVGTTLSLIAKEID